MNLNKKQQIKPKNISKRISKINVIKDKELVVEMIYQLHKFAQI